MLHKKTEFFSVSKKYVEMKQTIKCNAHRRPKVRALFIGPLYSIVKCLHFVKTLKNLYIEKKTLMNDVVFDHGIPLCLHLDHT